MMDYMVSGVDAYGNPVQQGRIVGQVIDPRTGMPVNVGEYGNVVQIETAPTENITYGQTGLVGGQLYAKEVMAGRAVHVSDATMAQMIQGITGIVVTRFVSIEDSPQAYFHSCPNLMVNQMPFRWLSCNVIRVQRDEKNMYQVPVYYCEQCGKLIMCRQAYR